MAEKTCEHLSQAVEGVTPSDEGCSECLESGGEWVHLRMCMVCGHVGCCDSSPNRHASGHARDEGHLVVQSFEPGERWAWCYEDEELLDDVGPELDRAYD